MSAEGENISFVREGKFKSAAGCASITERARFFLLPSRPARIDSALRGLFASARNCAEKVALLLIHLTFTRESE